MGDCLVDRCFVDLHTDARASDLVGICQVEPGTHLPEPCKPLADMSRCDVEKIRRCVQWGVHCPVMKETVVKEWHEEQFFKLSYTGTENNLCIWFGEICSCPTAQSCNLVPISLKNPVRMEGRPRTINIWNPYPMSFVRGRFDCAKMDPARAHILAPL